MRGKERDVEMGEVEKKEQKRKVRRNKGPRQREDASDGEMKAEEKGKKHMEKIIKPETELERDGAIHDLGPPPRGAPALQVLISQIERIDFIPLMC